MNPIGYLLCGGGVISTSGQYYNYVIAKDGIYISADNPLISAQIPIAVCNIRGLSPTNSILVLIHGKIPVRIFDLAMSVLIADCTRERYVPIVWNNDSYRIDIPGQCREKAKVTYETVENTVLELHSHPDMPATFSPQDNSDEQGLKLYGVVGNIAGDPVINLRIGVHGYFHSISWSDVFEGSLEGCSDINEENEIVQDRQERSDRCEDRSSRLWWYRWLHFRRSLQVTGKRPEDTANRL